MKQATCLVLVAVVGTLCGIEPAVAQATVGGSHVVGAPVGRAGWPLEGSCSFTQNADFTLKPGGSIACGGPGGTTDNQFLRVFDLDGEHGLTGQVCVDSLDYAIELAQGGVEVTFNVYCTPQGLADDAITQGIDRDQDLDPGLVYSVSITHRDAELEFFNQPLGGCCDAATADLAIEIASEDCAENGTCSWFYPGTDDFQASKPYYIGAPDCGIADPINADLITGLGVPALLMQVNATCEDGGADVPAADPLGVSLLLLVLLAAGSLLARRRAAG
jgi:hypothetical protein